MISKNPREELRRGRWPWAYPTLLAPMEGVTRPELRDLVASYGGVGVVCTEFVRVTKSSPSPRHLRRQVEKTPHSALSVQVMGREVEQMALATRLVAAEGADVIDLNLGCPAPNAVKKGVGAAMLEDLDLLDRVVGEMRRHTAGPLSAKMRAGVTDDSRAVEIAQRLEAAGVDFITVHPRRQVDVFRGRPRLRIIREVKGAVRVPVVGNGDCWSASDALAMMHQTGCDAVMIGRPALRNPWIFAQLAALSSGRPLPLPDGQALLDHFERYVALVSVPHEGVMLGLLKEQLRYTTRSLKGGAALLKRLHRAQRLEDLWQILTAEFSGLSARDLDLGTAPSRGDSEPLARYAPSPIA